MSWGVTVVGVCADHGRANPVLRDVSLDVAPGELLSVLGPSGSGKTTLIRVLAGLHRPTRGRVAIAGVDVTDAPPERRGVGLVPQDGALFGHLSVAGNIAYGLRGVRRRRAPTHPRVRELLDLVGLSGLGQRLPHELSGGQQQRVALARALAPDPRVVLLDEPFNALDAGLRQQVRDDVVDVLRSAGVSAFLVTHDQDEAMSVSDRVAVLREGVLLQVGSPEDIYLRPADAWTARFVGDALVLPATWTAAGWHTVLGPIPVGGSDPGPLRATGHVLVRPEQLALVPAGRGQVSALVTRVRFLGSSTLIDARLDSGHGGPEEMLVRVPGSSTAQIGERVGVVVHGPLHVLPDRAGADAGGGPQGRSD